ncbi:unnamed protein product [Caenorhabditis auriculariae]|uniref:Uncharacterized protein n=1 Tax=Caenorhabditis auriculariae TaxID=2777116 RepID=A0A8S1HTP4_9PELO|nr:unnamed protein product [Caenorhabditis auriculariae]
MERISVAHKNGFEKILQAQTEEAQFILKALKGRIRGCGAGLMSFYGLVNVLAEGLSMITTCREVPAGKNRTRMECSIEQTYSALVGMFQIGSPISNIMLIAQAGLLVIFWTCTFAMKRDFTKSFLISVCLLMTVDVSLRGTQLLVQIFDPYLLPYTVSYWIHTLGLVFNCATRYAFAAGSLLFTVFSFRTACTRTQMAHGCCTCVPFMIIAAAAVGLSAMAYMNMLSIYEAPILRYAFLIIGSLPVFLAKLLVVLMCICCCCLRPKVGMALDDPVVWNAKSRLFWCIPLLISASLTCTIDIVSYLMTSPYSAKWSVSEVNVVILVAVFLFLPAYRSKLFCGCCLETQRSRVAPLAEPSTATPRGPVTQLYQMPVTTASTAPISLPSAYTYVAPAPVQQPMYVHHPSQQVVFSSGFTHNPMLVA